MTILRKISVKEIATMLFFGTVLGCIIVGVLSSLVLFVLNPWYIIAALPTPLAVLVGLFLRRKNQIKS